jgi:hypothetical protein
VENKTFGVISLLAVLATGPIAAGQSVLNEGTWLKFSVTQTGVYRIDYQTLSRHGLNPGRIDPRNLKIFAYPTGMLPQRIDRPITDLQEIAIHVEGEADGQFNRNDFILFYGEGPDRYFFRGDKNLFQYENNLYSEKNFYFVTVGAGPGRRVQTETGPEGPFEPLTEYVDFAFYETEQHNELKSGREWWGEVFDTRTEINIRFDMPDMVPGSEVRLVSGVMARSVSPSRFTVLWNGATVVTQPMGTIPNTQWGVRGRARTDTVVFAATGASPTLTVQFTKGATNPSVGYLNFICFSATRTLRFRGAAMPFVLRATPQPRTVQIAQAGPDVTIWNVQDPFSVKHQAAVASGGQLQFGFAAAQPTAFLAFAAATTPPRFEGAVTNQNLHQTPAAALVIITHPDFRAAANRLAAHRRQQGIATHVVTTEEVYNEFSGGRQDVSALRNYLHLLYQRPNSMLRHVLLLGRASYDYKSRVFNNTNRVPTYQSVNSLHPLETYGSDDYYGFLEPGEGEWCESPAQDHTLDIGVGRLPVRTPAEAHRVVDKLIRYDSEINSDNPADWRKRITFVADDGDFNTHQSQANQLADELEFRQPGYIARRIYLDAFPQEERASGQFSPLTTRAIKDAVQAGTYIVNFIGHGSEQIWMQERVLDQITVTELRNAPRWPLFVTATCEFGRADDPLLISTGELLLLRADGGAIGLVTTARPVNSATNFTLNRAFYLAFLQNQNQNLGTLFRQTKNLSLSGVANRNFSLLGDPSMKFGPPALQARIVQAKTLSHSDTLRAMSQVQIRGEIMANGIRHQAFNGWAEVTVYDKPVVVQTRGDENPPFSFPEWRHALFRGRAAVNHGAFELQTVLPKNLNQALGHGKIAVLAHDHTQNAEAIGSMERVWIGGIETTAPAAPAGPDIRLFMGDTTFVEGGLVSPTTRLIGRLSDPQGINQAGYRPYLITATLDGATEFDLTDFYRAGEAFTSGSFDFPIDNLKPGPHEILVKAYDNHNHRGTATIRFAVAGAGEITVDALRNYPNPFTERTTFEFVHSRSGEELEAVLTVFNIQGQVVHTQNYVVNQSTFRVVLGQWDGHSHTGIKMPAGVYYYRLAVRSLKDGASSEKFSKLVLLN